jgi:hypothetical protein
VRRRRASDLSTPIRKQHREIHLAGLRCTQGDEISIARGTQTLPLYNLTYRIRGSVKMFTSSLIQAVKLYNGRVCVPRVMEVSSPCVQRKPVKWTFSPLRVTRANVIVALRAQDHM